MLAALNSLQAHVSTVPMASGKLKENVLLASKSVKSTKRMEVAYFAIRSSL